jgi:chemotaxis protein CheD
MTPNCYYDDRFNIDAVKILPGEYYATARPILIVTVVGSCVAACIRDRVSGIGGMTHFTLPVSDSYEDFGNASDSHGHCAMELLINQLLAMGAQREHLEAKIFGGSMLQSSGRVQVGRHNCDFLRSYLEREKIPVLADDLLGRYPRKIYFFPDQGKVLVKKLMRLHNGTILQREQEYIDRLHDASDAVCDTGAI